MSGYLTTHVLDILHGKPAASMTIELWRCDAQTSARALLKRTRTNSDGRMDEPLLSGAAFMPGIYELIFDVGEYFAAQGVDTPMPAFLERVPVRFGVADTEAQYHVPLLVSPWAYSTYRGS